MPLNDTSSLTPLRSQDPVSRHSLIHKSAILERDLDVLAHPLPVRNEFVLTDFHPIFLALSGLKPKLP